MANANFVDLPGYTRTGDWLQYESQYFGRRNKLTLVVIGELVSRQGKYLPEIADGLWMMLEESSWAVPSTLHMLQQASRTRPSDPVHRWILVRQTGPLPGRKSSRRYIT